MMFRRGFMMFGRRLVMLGGGCVMLLGGFMMFDGSFFVVLGFGGVVFHRLDVVVFLPGGFGGRQSFGFTVFTHAVVVGG